MQKAKVGLEKAMSGEPSEQQAGNELIGEAATINPDAVEELRQDIQRHSKRLGKFGR